MTKLLTESDRLAFQTDLENSEQNLTLRLTGRCLFCRRQRHTAIRAVLREEDALPFLRAAGASPALSPLRRASRAGQRRHLGLLNENLILPFKSAKNYKR